MLLIKKFDQHTGTYIADPTNAGETLTEQAVNTLLENYFPDAVLSECKTDFFTTVEELRDNHPEGHVLLFTSGTRAFYGLSEYQPQMLKLMEDAKDRAAYASIIIGDTAQVPGFQKMRVLIVDDESGINGPKNPETGEYDNVLDPAFVQHITGDSTGKMDKDLAMDLFGSVRHTVQHRMTISDMPTVEGDRDLVCKGTFQALDFAQFAWKEGMGELPQVILPLSSVKALMFQRGRDLITELAAGFATDPPISPNDAIASLNSWLDLNLQFAGLPAADEKLLLTQQQQYRADLVAAVETGDLLELEAKIKEGYPSSKIKLACGLVEVNAWVGEKSKSEAGKMSISSLLPIFPELLKDVEPMVQAELDELARVRGNLVLLSEKYLVAARSQQNFGIEGDPESVEDVRIDPVVEVVDMALSTQNYELLEMPIVIKALKDFDAKQFQHVVKLKSRDIAFERGMIVSSGALKAGEICVPGVEDGERIIAFRSPLLHANGIIDVVNRVLPEMTAVDGEQMEGTIFVSKELQISIQTRVADAAISNTLAVYGSNLETIQAQLGEVAFQALRDDIRDFMVAEEFATGREKLDRSALVIDRILAGAKLENPTIVGVSKVELLSLLADEIKLPAQGDFKDASYDRLVGGSVLQNLFSSTKVLRESSWNAAIGQQANTELDVTLQTLIDASVGIEAKAIQDKLTDDLIRISLVAMGLKYPLANKQLNLINAIDGLAAEELTPAGVRAAVSETIGADMSQIVSDLRIDAVTREIGEKFKTADGNAAEILTQIADDIGLQSGNPDWFAEFQSARIAFWEQDLQASIATDVGAGAWQIGVERMGADYDGDCIAWGLASKYPNLAIAVAERLEVGQRYADSNKAAKQFFPPTWRNEEVALYQVDNPVGLISNQSTAFQSIESEINILLEHGSRSQISNLASEIKSTVTKAFAHPESDKDLPPIPYPEGTKELISAIRFTELSDSAVLLKYQEVLRTLTSGLGYANQLAVDKPKSYVDLLMGDALESLEHNRRLLVHDVSNRTMKDSKSYSTGPIAVDNFTPQSLLVAKVNDAWSPSTLASNPMTQYANLFGDDEFNDRDLAIANDFKAKYNLLLKVATDLRQKEREEGGPSLDVVQSLSAEGVTAGLSPIKFELANLAKFNSPVLRDALLGNVPFTIEITSNKYETKAGAARQYSPTSHEFVARMTTQDVRGKDVTKTVGVIDAADAKSLNIHAGAFQVDPVNSQLHATVDSANIKYAELKHYTDKFIASLEGLGSSPERIQAALWRSSLHDLNAEATDENASFNILFKVFPGVVTDRIENYHTSTYQISAIGTVGGEKTIAAPIDTPVQFEVFPQVGGAYTQNILKIKNADGNYQAVGVVANESFPVEVGTVGTGTFAMKGAVTTKFDFADSSIKDLNIGKLDDFQLANRMADLAEVDNLPLRIVNRELQEITLSVRKVNLGTLYDANVAEYQNIQGRLDEIVSGTALTTGSGETASTVLTVAFADGEQAFLRFKNNVDANSVPLVNFKKVFTLDAKFIAENLKFDVSRNGNKIENIVEAQFEGEWKTLGKLTNKPKNQALDARVVLRDKGLIPNAIGAPGREFEVKLRPDFKSLDFVVDRDTMTLPKVAVVEVVNAPTPQLNLYNKVTAAPLVVAAVKSEWRLADGSIEVADTIKIAVSEVDRADLIDRLKELEVPFHDLAVNGRDVVLESTHGYRAIEIRAADVPEAAKKELFGAFHADLPQRWQDSYLINVSPDRVEKIQSYFARVQIPFVELPGDAGLSRFQIFDKDLKSEDKIGLFGILGVPTKLAIYDLKVALAPERDLRKLDLDYTIATSARMSYNVPADFNPTEVAQVTSSPKRSLAVLADALVGQYGGRACVAEYGDTKVLQFNFRSAAIADKFAAELHFPISIHDGRNHVVALPLKDAIQLKNEVLSRQVSIPQAGSSPLPLDVTSTDLVVSATAAAILSSKFYTNNTSSLLAAVEVLENPILRQSIADRGGVSFLNQLEVNEGMKTSLTDVYLQMERPALLVPSDRMKISVVAVPTERLAEFTAQLTESDADYTVGSDRLIDRANYTYVDVALPSPAVSEFLFSQSESVGVGVDFDRAIEAIAVGADRVELARERFIQGVVISANSESAFGRSLFAANATSGQTISFRENPERLPVQNREENYGKSKPAGNEFCSAADAYYHFGTEAYNQHLADYVESNQVVGGAKMLTPDQRAEMIESFTPIRENLMTEILTARFEQYAELFDRVRQAGGSNFIQKCAYENPHINTWNGSGVESPFVRALDDAYCQVLTSKQEIQPEVEVIPAVEIDYSAIEISVAVEKPKNQDPIVSYCVSAGDTTLIKGELVSSLPDVGKSYLSPSAALQGVSTAMSELTEFLRPDDKIGTLNIAVNNAKFVTLAEKGNFSKLDAATVVEYTKLAQSDRLSPANFIYDDNTKQKVADSVAIELPVVDYSLVVADSVPFVNPPLGDAEIDPVAIEDKLQQMESSDEVLSAVRRESAMAALEKAFAADDLRDISIDDDLPDLSQISTPIDLRDRLESTGSSIVVTRVSAPAASLPEGAELVKIDRSSVLGNPFYLADPKDSKQRDLIVSAYSEYLYAVLDGGNPVEIATEIAKESNLSIPATWKAPTQSAFVAEFDRLVEIASVKPLALGCHCAPAACHGDPLKATIEQELMNRVDLGGREITGDDLRLVIASLDDDISDITIPADDIPDGELSIVTVSEVEIPDDDLPHVIESLDDDITTPADGISEGELLIVTASEGEIPDDDLPYVIESQNDDITTPADDIPDGELSDLTDLQAVIEAVSIDIDLAEIYTVPIGATPFELLNEEMKAIMMALNNPQQMATDLVAPIAIGFLAASQSNTFTGNKFSIEYDPTTAILNITDANTKEVLMSAQSLQNGNGDTVWNDLLPFDGEAKLTDSVVKEFTTHRDNLKAKAAEVVRSRQPSLSV
jgi:Domain of unknown function (DUF4326)